jgi:hypothetical protein
LLGLIGPQFHKVDSIVFHGYPFPLHCGFLLNVFIAARQKPIILAKAGLGT